MDLGPSPLEYSPLEWPAIEIFEEMTKDLDTGSQSTSSTASTCCSSSSSSSAYSSSSASSTSSSSFGKIATFQSTSQLISRAPPVAKSIPLIGPVRTQRVSLPGQQGRLTSALYEMAVAKRKEVRQIYSSFLVKDLLSSIRLFACVLYSTSLFTPPLLTSQDEPFIPQTYGSCSFKMNEEWSSKANFDCIEEREREKERETERDMNDREKDKDTAGGLAALRSSRHCGIGIAPLRIPNLSVRIEEGSPLSSPRKKHPLQGLGPGPLQARGTSARLPSTPHPRNIYPSSDSDSAVDASYGPSDWDEEVYKVEEEIDTDDDVAQIERARRIRDGCHESDTEVVRKTMRRMEIESEDSEGEGEGPDYILRARERGTSLITLADADAVAERDVRFVLWILQYLSIPLFACTFIPALLIIVHYCSDNYLFLTFSNLFAISQYHKAAYKNYRKLKLYFNKNTSIVSLPGKKVYLIESN